MWVWLIIFRIRSGKINRLIIELTFSYRTVYKRTNVLNVCKKCYFRIRRICWLFIALTIITLNDPTIQLIIIIRWRVFYTWIPSKKNAIRLIFNLHKICYLKTKHMQQIRTRSARNNIPSTKILSPWSLVISAETSFIESTI